ncbi:fumarylacetoacetate hydrolase family protein [Helcobacillus massiliensis]|uniref:fumarylacetoacetate hydrolase family protein n=2 Tax=Helcobacillus TaxID=1161125 RepID=UPI0025566DA1|nr:fumarylacetoacetate hydrolase family protein [Helcobacillus massiliensis]MDK7741864.1 fumarylacetoacetate hydrolase family protein [Helcobacillus massiliensis]WOO92945.1 fumarylacetoacetate hydrolase family protein [Helcobacillus massiliensis]
MTSVTSPTSAEQSAPHPAEAAWSLLGTKPGAVYAMHISYAARAEQKGRTPEAPGYFMKPPTSLTTPTGEDPTVVELPKGAEILGFEGEIALVIGERTRRVSPTDAWGRVAAVTAANDLGAFDFRWADKGANVRSKGGDGYAPIGPRLIPADRLDPANIAIRVWLDGDLVQEDSTSTLLFPLPQIVSDLSQLITLEKGDVILTGTPAGASTFGPGQVVEVEVTAGGSEDPALSSGRLRTQAVQGTVDLEPFSPQPKPTAQQWADASGRDISEFSGADGGAGSVGPLTDDMRERIEKVALATISSVMRSKGLNNVSIDGVRTTQPGKKLIGTARTLRYVPNREDLFKSHGGGYNAQKRLFDSLTSGDVLVMDARGVDDAGTLGDILALRARALGAAGIVTDGCVRDLAEVTEIGLPTYHKGGHPAVLGRRHVPWGIDETVACGSTTVQPGDVIVGDDDGVLVIPPSMLENIISTCETKEAEEAFIAARVAEGHPVEGLFPMNAEWRAEFEKQR